MKAVIEVGANMGTDTDKLLKKHKNAELFLVFEPVEELAEKLKQKYSKDKRVIVYQIAVDKTDGMKQFNITKTAPNIRAKYGSSSLYNFRDGLKDEWDREDFEMEKSVLTETCRLDTMIEKHKITEIEYLHVDAQGNDLRVLESLGKYASIVKHGIVEVTKNIALYDDEYNTYENAKKVFSDLGFIMTAARKNDNRDAEINVYFKPGKATVVEHDNTPPIAPAPAPSVDTEGSAETWLNMARAQYNTKGVGWSPQKRNKFPIGTFDELNEISEYDSLLFRDIDTKKLVALDYGCAPGRLIAKFHNKFQKIDGVDISSVGVDKTKEYLETQVITNSEILVNDGMTIPHEDESYDVVFSMLVFQHIPVFEIRDSIFKDIYRVLKKGGKFTFQIGFGGRSRGNSSRYTENNYMANATNGQYDVAIYNIDEIKQHLTDIGFKYFKHEFSNSGPMCTHNSWLWIEVEK